MATNPSKKEMARKAQVKAEESFLAGNIYAAKQWMVSAVRLAPDLPGNAQAVAAYNVHAAAARTPPDWYAVLDLPDPRATVITHDAVKRQHRKLCLLVHPDKNPSKAAGGAFKFVQDAFEALSARHPPSAAPAPAPTPRQEPRWPARPPDPPSSKPRPRPQVVQMQRPSSRYEKPPEPRKQETVKPPPQPQRRPVSPPPAVKTPSAPEAGSCPACGASTPSSGKSTFRCMSCHWSPVDQRCYDDDDYDDDDDYYYY